MVPRITEAIDESKLTRLTGGVPFLARPEFDQGRANQSTRLTHLRLVLQRSPEQESALQVYLAELHDKSSPNYQKWLSPEQFGALYGPSDSDIAKLVSWLESHELDVEQVSKGRTDIAFSGTVSQIEGTFHTQIHTFSAGDQAFTSNIAEPRIPSALAQVVSGVAHLNTIHPRPLSMPGRFGVVNKDTKQLTIVPDAVPTRAEPQLTTGSNGAYQLFITAADAATIYNSPNTLNGNFSGSTENQGFRVSIGVGGDAVINTSTAGNYGAFTRGGFAPSTVNVDGVTSTADSDEAYIDTELAHALAPGAAVTLYTSTDLISAIERAINDNHVDIFSLSFGECELGLTTSGNAHINSLWQQAAAQGIAVTVSTGDTGSAGCDAPTDNTGKNISAAQHGMQVSGFASTPYNVAVGGTDFYALPPAFTTYASTTNGFTDFRSALKYIPESTWNDSTTANGLLANNAPQPADNQNIVAASGGVSTCATNTTSGSTLGTCTGGYAKPSWQQAAGVPADGARDLPDVSLMAGNGMDSAAWLVCTDDTFTSGGVTYTADCSSNGSGFAFGGFGGTSTSAPAFAGILALIQSKTGIRLGQAAQELYQLSNGPHGSAIFHDIAVGNISVPCASGTPNCSTNAAGYLFETGYDASSGYDLATGLGSVDAGALVTYWGSATGSTVPTVTVTPSATTVPASQSISVTVSVTGTSSLGAPTGRITLVGGGYSSGSTILTNGSYQFTINPGTLTVGTDTLTATYSGDPNYTPANASATVDVTGPYVNLSPSSLTFPNTAIGSSSAPQTVVMKNVGTDSLAISGIVAVDIWGGYKETNDCGATLAVGAFCTVSVTFAPTAQESLPGQLQIIDNAANSPQSASLNGISYTPAPAITLSPNVLSFPNTAVNTPSTAQPVLVTNSGTAMLSISGISVSGMNPTSFAQTNNCPTSLGPNATCTIDVTFTPSSFGSQSALVAIADNASNSPQYINMSGTGVELGAYTLSASPVTLTVGATGKSTITAIPSGGYTGTITINSCVIASSPAGATGLPACSITSATVTVGATPTNGIVTIGTVSPQAYLAAGRSGNSGVLGTAGSLVLGGAFIFFCPRFRRRGNLVLIILLSISVAAIFGCSGGGGSSSNNGTGIPGTTRGSYAYTVAGTDASGVKQTATIAVTVN